MDFFLTKYLQTKCKHYTGLHLIGFTPINYNKYNITVKVKITNTNHILLILTDTKDWSQNVDTWLQQINTTVRKYKISKYLNE